MPAWNLRDDLLEKLNPPDEPFFEPFCEPILGTVADKRKYALGIEIGSTGEKKLRIDIQSSNEVNVLAMTAGTVTTKGNRLILTTDRFTLEGINKLICHYSLQVSLSEYPVNWFLNWHLANTIPRKIIYENIKDEVYGPVATGARIGKANGNGGKKQIRISIQYERPEEGRWNTISRFMHPREFFSLLFWREEHDPVFNSDGTSLPEYGHPLLQKMMESKADGNTGTFDSNEWLGLRPPMRTSKRAEWEAKREHILHHENWQRAGDLTGIIRNPKILPGGGYVGESKCNILAGEIAFNSGFRVFVRKQSGKLKYKAPGYKPPTVSYRCTGLIIEGRCGNHSCDRRCIRLYGRKRFIRANGSDQASRQAHENFVAKINNDIGESGKLYILSSNDHVVTLSSISAFPNSGVVQGFAFDQHCMKPPDNAIPRDIVSGDHPRIDMWNTVLPNCKSTNPVDVRPALIELLPGGDPTEEWGITDLNCL